MRGFVDLFKIWPSDVALAGLDLRDVPSECCVPALQGLQCAFCGGIKHCQAFSLRLAVSPHFCPFKPPPWGTEHEMSDSE